jgi:predicted anti-sigma-YlaC factor YlaD
MTCQECELALASEPGEAAEVDRDLVDRHLARCAACREFAGELRANCDTFAAFSRDPIPPVSISVAPRSRPVRWQWAAAIAAMLVLALTITFAMRSGQRIRPVADAPVPQVAAVHPAAEPSLPMITPVRHHAPRKPRSNPVQKNEPHILQVKMLTDDPDVVIYWQIEN